MTGSPFGDGDVIFHGCLSSVLAEREALIPEVLKALEEAGVEFDPHFDRLCLDELLINAIRHGNAEDPDKYVEVRAFRTATHWGIEVTDEGPGFDGERLLQDLGKEPVSIESSGRGLAIIAASGADVRFLEGGQRVLMVRER